MTQTSLPAWPFRADDGARVERDPYRHARQRLGRATDNSIANESGWPRPFILNELTYGIDSISTGVLTAIRMPDAKVFKAIDFAYPAASDPHGDRAFRLSSIFRWIKAGP